MGKKRDVKHSRPAVLGDVPAELPERPGKPRQNAFVERCRRTFRNEQLDAFVFESVEDVQERAASWLWTYSNERPSMAIGGVAPAMKIPTVDACALRGRAAATAVGIVSIERH